MTNKQFTVIDSNSDLGVKAPVGTRILVKVDATNNFDPLALRAYREDNGDNLGFIGAKAVARGSLTNNEMHEMVTKAGLEDGYLCIVVGHEKVKVGNNRSFEVNCAIIESLVAPTEEPATTVGGESFEFVVKGTARKYKAKVDVIKDLVNGEKPTLDLVMEGETIVAMYDGTPAGEVDAKSKEIDMAVKIIKTLGNVKATANNPQNATYTVKFTVDEESMIYVRTGKKVLTLTDVKEEKSAFIPEERLNALQSYMEKAGLTKKQIMKVMQTYREYPAEVQSRIPEPKKFFKDDFGAIRKTVVYMNKGKHLRLVGEKGTGKNLLTTVLAWLYQRPLYELSLNSQSDKMDLLGSKTFSSTTDADGKETTVISFQKEALVEAMEVGGFLNLDEANTADPAVLVLLHSIIDDRGSLEVPSYGRVQADDNFGIILTMNANYIGTNELNEATRDRFTPILFPSNKSIESLLMENVKDASSKDIKLADRVYHSIWNLVQDGSLSTDCLTVRGFIDAVEVSEDLGLKEALEDSVANRIDDEEYRVSVMSIIDDIVG